MALLWWAGFEYGDPAEIWSDPGSGLLTPVPRTGVNGFELRTTESYRNLGADEDDLIIVGIAVDYRNCVTDEASNFRFYEGGSTVHVRVRMNMATQAFTVFRGESVATLGTTANGSVPANGYNYYEIKVVIHDTTGSVVIKKNMTETILNLTGIDTKNAGTDGLIDRVSFYGAGSGSARPVIDDPYICNGVDASATQGRPNNDFLGDVRAYPSSPNGDGNSSQLLGSDGNSVNNSLLVDEKGTPNDADYNGSATPGQKDTYATEDVPLTNAVVYGVAYHIRALKSDGGAISGRRVYRNSGTEDAGSDLVLSTTATNYIEYLPRDPITAAAWTVARVNSREDGFEVRA